MSTILRALKKLEQENAEAPVGGSTASHTFAARRAVHRGVRFKWRKGRRVRWGLLAGVLLAVAAGLYRFYPTDGVQGRNWTAPAPSSGAHEPERVENDALPSQTAYSGAEALTERSLSKPPDPVEPAKPQSAASAERSINPAEPQADPAVPVAPRRRLRPALEPLRPAPAANPEKQTPASTVKRATPPPVALEAERIPEDRLKIQAIAWSPDPQDRMAVINNRILHEGESVDGYTILMIDEDQIIFNAEGRRWRAVFGRR